MRICRGRYPELDALGVETLQGDLRDCPAVVAACQGVDVVFYVAGMAGIWGPWRQFYDINAMGTRHVVEGCWTHGVSRLVYTSSPSVTFDGCDQCGVDESAPYPRRWLCHYPHSKALAEQHVLAANGRHSLLTCALRPHLIWGSRDRHLIPRLVERARNGRLRRVGDGTNRIDMVYVENAARARSASGRRTGGPGSPVAGQAYFISQGEPVNCWQWINEILALAQLPPIRNSISFRSAWHMGALLEGVYRLFRLPGEPPMTRFLASQLARSHWFDISPRRGPISAMRPDNYL